MHVRLSRHGQNALSGDGPAPKSAHYARVKRYIARCEQPRDKYGTKGR